MIVPRGLVDRVWWSDDPLARGTRLALSPLELAFRGVVAVRTWGYDHRLAHVHDTALPALSIGNLVVGGTGKTPLAAWAVAGLLERGAHPAIVLRGYGGDEPLVHRALNPSAPVIISADRVAGTVLARDAGCDVAVLDNAMQHRRAARVADVALINADRWDGRRRTHMLPAGPWREPVSALRRSTVIVITRKSAGPDDAAAIGSSLASVAPGVPTAVVHLAADEIRRWDGGETAPASVLGGRRVYAVAAVGDPRAFAIQLERLGATVRLRALPDHHAFDTEDARSLASAGASEDLVVCTLKDAVKLGPLWPRAAAPLWYVSQRVHVEEGAVALDAVLDRVAAQALTARADTPSADRRRAPANSSSHAH